MSDDDELLPHLRLGRKEFYEHHPSQRWSEMTRFEQICAVFDGAKMSPNEYAHMIGRTLPDGYAMEGQYTIKGPDGYSIATNESKRFKRAEFKNRMEAACEGLPPIEKYTEAVAVKSKDEEEFAEELSNELTVWQDLIRMGEGRSHKENAR